jgi:Flp pilus assembly pilin Flp
VLRIYVWTTDLLRSLKDERGQDLTEYAVITGSIAIGALAAAMLAGLAFGGWFGRLDAWVDGLNFTP